MKKSQITLFIGILITFFILIIIIFLLIKDTSIKNAELEKTKKELFILKLNNYMSFSNDCLEKSFLKGINEYGFETEEIKGYIKFDFPNCINQFSLLEKDYNLNNIDISVEENENTISVKLNLETTLKMEDQIDKINEYRYMFSKISFKNLKIENNELAFDTKIVSTDENAILYLKKGTSFSLNNEPISQISIKVDKKPDFSFIIGDFIYDLEPDNLKSSDLMELRIKYKDEWLNGLNPYDLKIAYLNDEKKEWRFLPTIVNIKKKELIIYTNHFSKYVIVNGKNKIPFVEKKDDEIYLSGFYNGGLYSDEQNAITQESEKKQIDNLNSEYCERNNNLLNDINIIRKKITIPL
ncbi:MAG: hypothetical protein QXE31_01500 [Candidatus Woesearchaeota archaeon]